MVQQPVPYLVLSMSLTTLSSLSGLKIGILAISNDRHALDKMDRRVKSRFYFEPIESKPYSSKDIVEIMSQRLGHCLVIIISENPNIVSTQLYRNYRKHVKSRKEPVAPRTFRKYLEELILKGIIKAIRAKKERARVLVAVI